MQENLLPFFVCPRFLWMKFKILYSIFIKKIPVELKMYMWKIMNTRGKYYILFKELKRYSKHVFQKHKSHRKDWYILLINISNFSMEINHK